MQIGARTQTVKKRAVLERIPAPACIFTEEREFLTNHGGPSRQSGLGPLGEVIHGGGAPVGHLEVCVDVDPTRNNHLPIGLDSLHPSWDDQVVSNLPCQGAKLG